MTRFFLTAIVSTFACLPACLSCAAVAAAEPPETQADMAVAPQVEKLAARIDRHLSSAWQESGVAVADAADDATFVRRIYLDLVGRIPTVAEVRVFLADERGDKRAQLIDRLVASGGHARHFATFWRRAWIPQADTPEFEGLTEEFESWAAMRLRDNVPYDQLVREMLTYSRTQQGEHPSAMPAADRRSFELKDVTPVGFLAASQFRPENLAATTTRAFLGLNLDCAQCHDHPFSRWTRDQFWQTAAFFVSASTPGDSGGLLQISIPNTQRTVHATFLDESQPWLPQSAASSGGRAALADWIVGQENPYFARNAVNRVWAHFFGWGLVEPLDDLSDENPASLPALLDELSQAFVASGYDLNALTRAITRTHAYQLSTISAAGPPNGEQRPLFQRMPVRGLTGEQLYDSLRVAAGLPIERRDLLELRPTNDRAEFASRMLISRPVDAERSIVQSLALMNGGLTGELTKPMSSPMLATAVDAPFLNAQEKVELLFLATLSRPPTDAESSRLLNYLESGGQERSAAESLGNVFWSLLNSSEFNTNH